MKVEIDIKLKKKKKLSVIMRMLNELKKGLDVLSSFEFWIGFLVKSFNFIIIFIFYC